jgi:hypothetical protein
VSVNFVSKIEKVLSKESCCGVGVAMCCFLSYCQHFPCQMIGIIRQFFWNKSFEERFAHMLDIPRSLHKKGNCNCAKFLTIQERDVFKTAWYKIMGISRSTYMSYKQKRV